MINFKTITGFEPFPFQAVRHDYNEQPICILSCPTGSGKTEAYFANWVLDLIEKPTKTPKRLVIQLPLRTLVEQTAERVEEMIGRSGLNIKTCVLMGGQIEDDFIHEPEQPTVIVGTLDQILSRQLMRPYCASKWSAPLHFNALNNNARIVVDETQLQDLAYPTALQIQRIYQKLGGFHPRELLLCSATLNRKPLKNTEFGGIEISEEDKKHPVYSSKFGREKNLHLIDPFTDDDFINLVNEKHIDGTMTLVVVNTVKRAQTIYDGIKAPKRILHSRFRKADRDKLQDGLKSFRGVIVSTQVVEAGVDLDCRTLLSDLCPWSSAVQRAGRAGRNGTYDECDIYFIDTEQFLPYQQKDMRNCWEHLKKLPNFNISTVLENNIDERIKGCALTETDFLDLCDNRERPVEPSISQYVREIDDGNVFVAWRDSPSKDMRMVQRHEIVPVSWQEVVRFVPEVWSFDDKDSEWKQEQLQKGTKIPVGSVVVIEGKFGCYHPELGWKGGYGAYVKELAPIEVDYGKGFAKSDPLDLKLHLEETRDFIIQIMNNTYFTDEDLINKVSRAGFLHDIGKATKYFQWFIQGGNPQDGVYLAKGDKVMRKHCVDGLRHEAHSALAAAAMDEDILITYLCMAHHGKVRTCYNGYSWIDEKDGRLHGVKTGDIVPHIPGVTTGDIEVKLPADHGINWSDVYYHLLDEYGIFKLIEMESLVRNGDVMSSRLHQQKSGESDTSDEI